MSGRVPLIEARLQTATKVPKEIDEKHELSIGCHGSGARMRAARDSKSAIAITYIDDLHFKPII